MDRIILYMDILNLMADGPFIPPLSTEVRQAEYCHLESRVFPSPTLRVACAGREYCQPGYHIARKGYVCQGLEFVAQGKGELVINGRAFRLLPGHIFLYGPGIPHEIRCEASAPMTKYFVDFFGGSRREDFLRGAIQPGEVRRVIDLESITRIFDALVGEGKRSSLARKDICAAYIKILLLKSSEAGQAETRAQWHSLANLNRCRAYLDTHAAALSGLQALAEAVHLDPRYICRLFKRFRLPTPYHYLVSLKMNQAAELLVVTNEPIKSVAGKVGYEDALHFSRVFSRTFGCPPREFRQQNVKH